MRGILCRNDNEICQKELDQIWSKLKKEKSIVFMRGNRIIKHYPDSTEEVLKTLVDGNWISKK